MKLIIDIDEKRYEWVKKNNPNADINSIVGAVANGTPYEERPQGKFECRIKIKDLISMLLEFDMNEKATICTTDEYNGNNIVISITDMRRKGEEE